jgi:hypothetical protein
MRNLSLSHVSLTTINAIFVLVTITGCSQISAPSVLKNPAQPSTTSAPSVPINPAQTSTTFIPLTDPVYSPTNDIEPTIISITATSMPVNTPKTTCPKDFVSGYVESGGDSTPSGLKDSPRHFLFQVRRESDGTVVNISYTSFPPSPNEKNIQKIRLNFHAGEIKIGDYIKSYGCFESDVKTLYVKEGGDYIETFPEKP